MGNAAQVTAFGMSDVGLARKVNEDAFGFVNLTNADRWQGGGAVTWTCAGAGVLLEVSDGMGGAKAGEVASALSIEGVLEGMLEAARRGEPNDHTLSSVIERVSKRVNELGHRPDRQGMGATLTAVLVKAKTAYVAQIGDSRAYLLREGAIGQITKDQSYVQMLVDAGVMTPEQAERSPRKNIILQVMGQESVKVDVGRIALRSGDRLLLCSDGLTNVIDDEGIRAIAKSPADIVRAVEMLIRATRDGGAPDNVTAILAEFSC